ncbi:transmembrane amino acid transporter protein [Trichuris suis]|nr:transmembrane amino acid transporter protein [Trichuris suis]
MLECGELELSYAATCYKVVSWLFHWFPKKNHCTLYASLPQFSACLIHKRNMVCMNGHSSSELRPEDLLHPSELYTPLAVNEPLMPAQEEKNGEKKKGIEHKFEVEIVSASGTLDLTFYRQLHSARAKLPSGVTTGRTAVDYGEMGELAVALGPQRFRRHAHLFREAINIFLYLLQFGSCSVYFIFAAENIRQVADPEGYLPVVAYIAFLLPVELLLCSIRQLKWLAVPSTIANLLYLTAFGILFYYIFDSMPDWRRLPAVQSPVMWPLAFGSIMFAFSSAGTILPIENRCKTPGNLLRWNGVINTSYGIITILSVAVGMFGYIKYGEAIQGSITLNLPKDEV